MLGELNGSHTGTRYYSASSTPATASLGAFYDNGYTGDGLKVEEIIAKGPTDKSRQQDQTGLYHRKDRWNKHQKRRRLLSAIKWQGRQEGIAVRLQPDN